MRVHLVNPSDSSFGIGVITPRWLYVLAAATPSEYGEPLVTDETLEQIHPDRIVLRATAHRLHRGPHITIAWGEVPTRGQELISRNPSAFISTLAVPRTRSARRSYVR